MKNHRQVCFAVNAGYIEYKGLQGRVRSECPNTPCFKSRYCSLHKPVVAVPKDTPKQNCTDKSSTLAIKEDQVGLIIGK